MAIANFSCIDLDQPSLEGFRKFISSWLYQDAELCFLVDPGPLSTIPHLLGELRKRQVAKLDYILLTHIHIDHAGGTGALLQEFPDAQVICHPQGIKHMLAPEKLWQGSQQVLGTLAETYGEILPLPAGQISFAEEIGTTGIHAYLTPGHAQHHCCYQFGELLFAGEVVGVHCPVAEGIYMRPATPPRFIMEVAVESIERMIALNPKQMVIAHYGLVEAAVEHLKIGKKQLRLWTRGVALSSCKNEPFQEEEIFSWLLEHDEIYRNITQLENDIAARERFFLGNSLRGMQEYVANLTQEQKQALLADAG